MANPKPKTKSQIVAGKPPQIAHHRLNRRPAELLPEVFILESLSLADQRANRFEGRVLSDMLRMSNKNPIYHYFQHENELPHFVKLFEMSKYRYLHLSCHGDVNKIFTTYGEISDYELARIFKNSLKLKRLFFSACKVGNQAFSEIIAAQNIGMHSIAAPVEKIRFDHAAALWNALYLSLFTENGDRMTHLNIIKRLKALRQLFPNDFHFSGYVPGDKNNPWFHQIITAQPIAGVPLKVPQGQASPKTIPAQMPPATA